MAGVSNAIMMILLSYLKNGTVMVRCVNLMVHVVIISLNTTDITEALPAVGELAA